MKRLVLTGAAILVSISSLAIAQSATPTPAPMAPVAAAPPSTATVSKDTPAEKPVIMAAPVAAPGADGGGMFANVMAADDLSSQVVGLCIYNKEKQNIGAIKDIVMADNGVKAYIVGVGGFLGMGDRYVAIKPSAITLTYNAGEKTWHAEMDTDADKLKAAPEYKYAS